MKVIAKEGIKVPYEHRANQYIDGTEPVEVPDNAYYLRRIKDGDLIEVVETKKATTPKKTTKAAETAAVKEGE